jgi:hypothetical protein
VAAVLVAHAQAADLAIQADSLAATAGIDKRERLQLSTRALNTPGPFCFCAKTWSNKVISAPLVDAAHSLQHSTST